MALLIPIGFAHVVFELKMQGDNELMLTTLGVELGTGATEATVADDMFLSFANNIMPELSSALELQGVTAYVGNDGPPLVRVSTEQAVQGGNSAGTVPQNTAYLIRKRTDLAGRRGRGRMYWPGVPEANVDHLGNISPLSLTAWETILDDWHEELTMGQGFRLYPPVVLHRSEGIGTEPPPTPVQRFVMDPRAATQRRRMRP